MLAIGRALMARPRLLMLDEPSLGLAPLIVAEVFRLIESLKEQGATILLVEQNARKALAVADTRTCWRAGGSRGPAPPPTSATTRASWRRTSATTPDPTGDSTTYTENAPSRGAPMPTSAGR